MSYLETDSVRMVAGVGDAAQSALERLGIRTLGDLLLWYPRTYLDAAHPTPIAEAELGRLCAVKVTISSIHQRRSVGRGVAMVEATVGDLSGKLSVRWFNQPFLEKKLRVGSEWVLIGTIDLYAGKRSMLGPIIEERERVLPVYAQTKGVTSKMIRGFVEWALRSVELAADPLPEGVRAEAALLDRSQTLHRIHQPTQIEETEAAQARIAYEEVFWFFVEMLSGKERQRHEEGVRLTADPELLKGLVAGLPFELTAGQKRAVWDIVQEMESGHPMTRLLNGDVGSGKTIVAGLVAAAVAKAGWQTALLVPTEILARQHAVSLAAVLGAAGIRIGVWTAAQKDELAEADLVIGTHALLEEAFSLPRLALVVIDEQHRFGVRQRNFLRSQQQRPPHVLSMTATPIPRTLALTLYGNLSLSVLKEKPKDRLPILTELISAKERPAMHRQIMKELGHGNQVFVVCPLIEEKKAARGPEEGPNLQLFDAGELEGADKKSVLAEVERLRREHPEYGVIEAIHGKMKAKEKREIMERMARQEIQVLVATSVIEVGVDVPGATVMVIEGAERFGLAQLHQFRGRIGRNSLQSYCFLVPEVRSAAALERLQVLVDHESGFEVAERDLELRGPGEMTGQAQSGLPDFRMASLTDIAFLHKVKEDVQAYLAKNPSFMAIPSEAGYSALRIMTE